jgi:hypothetical protein
MKPQLEIRQISAPTKTLKALDRSRTESVFNTKSSRRAEPFLSSPKTSTPESTNKGAFESKGESGKREVKKSNATLGRHVTSKSGSEVSADRKKFVGSVRSKREKEAFDS